MKDWISIADRSPDFDVPVLVFGGGSIEIARLDRVVRTSTLVTHNFLIGTNSLDDWWISVTHWMPLPPPPPGFEKKEKQK